MRKYEAMFIMKSNLEEERRNEVINKFKSIIESDGEIESVDEWGNRKLAYPIQKLNDGYYVLINFKAGADLPKELDRNFKISDDVIRHMIVNLEEK
ncbi:SSU ribosomal protein S6P [Geosporobacter subterraneus DSM 17957]|uniref:Small ribosomal subunit protein bS6 n=1 Tax=Geosporobacter subterraneus DSM 17957 TaxID=1121919 RepID=A0A1M6KDT7_9FIRM|nr:30S ribosomal protein S6 [Geosporobacter subterraneus]SHJ57068.1 SSU ribosomal protein S6P [Geosporobacter subterraneus DSM 17957]